MKPEESAESKRELDRRDAEYKKSHGIAHIDQTHKAPKHAKRNLWRMLGANLRRPLEKWRTWTLPTKLSVVLGILSIVLSVAFWLWPRPPENEAAGELTDQVRAVVNEIITAAETKNPASKLAIQVGDELDQATSEGLKQNPYNVRALLLRGQLDYAETYTHGRVRFRQALNNFETAAHLDHKLADPHFGLADVLYQIALFDLANRGLYKIYEKGAFVFDKQTLEMDVRQPQWQLFPDDRNRLILLASLEQFQAGQKLQQIYDQSAEGLRIMYSDPQDVENTVTSLRTLLGYEPVLYPDKQLAMNFNAILPLVNSGTAAQVLDFRERTQQRHREQAAIALQKNDLKEALRLAETAMQEDPSDAGPHVTRAIVYVRERNWKQALDDFTVAVQLDPINPAWVFNRGVAHARLGQRKEAIADLAKCLAMNPPPEVASHARDELAKLRR